MAAQVQAPSSSYKFSLNSLVATDANPFASKDDQAVEDLKSKLELELTKISPEPVFIEGTRYLSKAFMLKMTELSHKFQLMAQILIKDQQQARRFAALKAKDDFAYMCAKAETEGRKLKLAMEVEDIVFDYFGIISIQFEISNKQLDRDMDYQVTKMRQQADIARDLNNQDQAIPTDLSLEKGMELAKRVQDFTMELMNSLAQVDPQSGKKYMNMGGEEFNLKLQKEQDRFLMETGYTTAQISKFMQQEKANAEAMKGKAATISI